MLSGTHSKTSICLPTLQAPISLCFSLSITSIQLPSLQAPISFWLSIVVNHFNSAPFVASSNFILFVFVDHFYSYPNLYLIFVYLFTSHRKNSHLFSFYPGPINLKTALCAYSRVTMYNSLIGQTVSKEFVLILFIYANGH